MKIISSIHDKTFKNGISDIRVAREFFEMHLPPKILSLIDLESLILQPNSYIDEHLNSCSSDVLYQVRLKSQEVAYIYILCEHQSTVDPLMPLRLWTYVMRIWNDIIKQNGEKVLPLIFPFVFYHGKEEYKGGKNLRDLIQAPINIIDEVLFQDFHLIDTHTIQDEELQNFHWAGILSFMFKHVYDREIWPHMQTIINMMKKIENENGALTFINLLLKYWYIAADTQKTQKEFIETLQQGLSKISQEEFMTLGERLIQQGVEQGIQKGVYQGEREFLTQLLEKKFQKIPTLYLERIERANHEILLNWGDKMLKASTIIEVFDS